MGTEQTIFIAMAAIAFGVALLAVITQWLKADELAAGMEEDVRVNLDRMRTAAQDPPERVAFARAEAFEGEAPAPARLADDETALSRLFLGWGAAGTVTGMAFGGVMWGVVGALMGAVVLSALSIAMVVVAVLVVDHARAKLAQERAAAKPKSAARYPQYAE
jgi:hypothetical protein